MPSAKTASLSVAIDAACHVQRPICSLRSALRNSCRPPILLAIALLAPGLEGLTSQKEKPPAPGAAPALSAEDKEILKYRDLLENIELLQNLEKIKYLDFFTEKKQRKSGANAPVKENAHKETNATPKPQ